MSAMLLNAQQEFRSAVARALADMAAAWPRAKIDPVGLLDVYLRGLRGVPIASIGPAVDALLQREAVKFAPPPGELRAECLRVAGQRGFGLASAPAAPERPRWSLPPEAPCPVCGKVADVRAEWTSEAMRYDVKRGRFACDDVQYAVTYPPSCACWEHETPKRTGYRHEAWLTAGQQWAGQQHLPERVAPDPESIGALTRFLAEIQAAERAAKQATAPADPWLTEERRGEPGLGDRRDAVTRERDADADREVA